MKQTGFHWWKANVRGAWTVVRVLGDIALIPGSKTMFKVEDLTKRGEWGEMVPQ